MATSNLWNPGRTDVLECMCAAGKTSPQFLFTPLCVTPELSTQLVDAQRISRTASPRIIADDLVHRFCSQPCAKPLNIAANSLIANNNARNITRLAHFASIANRIRATRRHADLSTQNLDKAVHTPHNICINVLIAKQNPNLHRHDFKTHKERPSRPHKPKVNTD